VKSVIGGAARQAASSRRPSKTISPTRRLAVALGTTVVWPKRLAPTVSGP